MAKVLSHGTGITEIGRFAERARDFPRNRMFCEDAKTLARKSALQVIIGYVLPCENRKRLTPRLTRVQDRCLTDNLSLISDAHLTQGNLKTLNFVTLRLGSTQPRLVLLQTKFKKVFARNRPRPVLSRDRSRPT